MDEGHLARLDPETQEDIYDDLSGILRDNSNDRGLIKKFDDYFDQLFEKIDQMRGAEKSNENSISDPEKAFKGLEGFSILFQTNRIGAGNFELTLSGAFSPHGFETIVTEYQKPHLLKIFQKVLRNNFSRLDTKFLTRFEIVDDKIVCSTNDPAWIKELEESGKSPASKKIEFIYDKKLLAGLGPNNNVPENLPV